MPRKPKGVIKDREFYSTIGKKGGLRTKRIMLRKDPDYYSKIGLKGGQAMLDRGFEYFSTIGKISAKKYREDNGLD